MPIYLVRWPDLTASLVRAEDEDQLLYILDEVANSEGCTWSVYEGPLFIDFRLPAEWSIRDQQPGKPISTDQVVVGNLGDMAERSVAASFDLSLAEGDTGLDTGSAILSKAFPSLNAIVERYEASDAAFETDFVLPDATLRDALHAELARLSVESWRLAQLENKTDPASLLAREMGMPVDLARGFVTGPPAERGESEKKPLEDE